MFPNILSPSRSKTKVLIEITTILIIEPVDIWYMIDERYYSIEHQTCTVTYSLY
jgi:hypothetical protein